MLPSCAGIGARPFADAVPADPPEIRVGFALEKTPTLCVRGSLVFLGSESGESELTVDASFGGGDAGADLVELRAGDDAGAPLSVRHPEPHRWIIRHAPGARIHAAWRMPGNARQDLAPAATGLKTLVDASTFFAIGHLTVPVPAYLDQDAPRVVEQTFTGFDPEATRCVSSFAVGAAPARFLASLRDLRHAVYVAAPLEMRERRAGGGVLLVAAEDGALVPDPDPFVDALAAVLDAERDVFGEPRPGTFVVAVVRAGDAARDDYGFTGAPLTRSFALVVAPGTPASEDTGEILRFFAHETLHRWIGAAIPVADPTGAEAWFAEGFTDGAARRVLRDAGLLAPAAVAEDLDLLLTESAANPQRQAPNTRIAEGFLTDPDLASLAYQRGDLVALLLEHRLRAEDGPSRDLGAFLAGLLARARGGGAPLDTEALLQAIGRATDPEFEATVRAIVVDGAAVELPLDVAAPDATLVPGDPPHFEAVGDARD